MSAWLKNAWGYKIWPLPIALFDRHKAEGRTREQFRGVYHINSNLPKHGNASLVAISAHGTNIILPLVRIHRFGKTHMSEIQTKSCDNIEIYKYHELWKIWNILNFQTRKFCMGDVL